MNERFNPYDARAWGKFVRGIMDTQKAVEADQTAEIIGKFDRMEAEGNPISPYGPEMSKLVNPRIR